MTRALVVGCGSIGTRHVENLLELDVDVTVCDVDEDRVETLAEEHDLDWTKDYASALEAGTDCVLVCTPPSSHVDIATAALDAGASTLVEKPIAESSRAAGPLVEAAASADPTVYVACNMRFHPPVMTIEDWLSDGRIGQVQFLRLRYGNALPNWRPGDYRDYYSATSKEGGGVVLDAIHELDLADSWLGGTTTVTAETGRFGGYEIESEDTAEILLGGTDSLAEVHLDYLRPVRARTYEIIGSDGMIRWHAEGKNPETSRVVLSDTDGTTELVREFESSLNKMYVAELRDFLECVRRGSDPPVGATRGTRLVELAERAKESSERGTTIHVS